MASLCNDGGLRRILVCIPGKGRPAIRLGRISQKKATTILARIEDLEACLLDGSAPSRETAAWLAEGCGDTLRERLALLGLAAPKDRQLVLTIVQLLDAYTRRPRWLALKPNTRRNQGEGHRYLLDHFGAGRSIATVTEAAAEDYRGRLSLPKGDGGKGLATSTANQACATAWAVFRFAVKSRIVDRNPFDDVERGHATRGDNVFVPAPDCVRVLAQLDCPQWKLLFALGRWGGLRTPSEPRVLRWGDVDWERGRLTVNSPKTGPRAVPIFPEIMPHLEASFDAAEPGEELVLPMMVTRADSTFASVVSRAAVRAGLTVWPRFWHSMRSTRQTELEELHPSHVVCAWIGNSVNVARRHYLQVTDDHFAKAAHNAAQPTTASPRTA